MYERLSDVDRYLLVAIIARSLDWYTTLSAPTVIPPSHEFAAQFGVAILCMGVTSKNYRESRVAAHMFSWMNQRPIKTGRWLWLRLIASDNFGLRATYWAKMTKKQQVKTATMRVCTYKAWQMFTYSRVNKHPRLDKIPVKYFTHEMCSFAPFVSTVWNPHKSHNGKCHHHHHHHFKKMQKAPTDIILCNLNWFITFETANHK